MALEENSIPARQGPGSFFPICRDANAGNKHLHESSTKHTGVGTRRHLANIYVSKGLLLKAANFVGQSTCHKIKRDVPL